MADALGKAKKFDQGLEKTEKRARTLGQRLGDLGGRLGGVGKSLFNLRNAAVVAATGGLFLLTKRAIDSAASIADVADKIGVGIEALQEWRYAAGRAGGQTQKSGRA